GSHPQPERRRRRRRPPRERLVPGSEGRDRGAAGVQGQIAAGGRHPRLPRGESRAPSLASARARPATRPRPVRRRRQAARHRRAGEGRLAQELPGGERASGRPAARGGGGAGDRGDQETMQEGGMMHPRDALLASLHADPADEVAWLALADALEEAGEPLRAELLRLHRSLPGLRPGKKRLAVEQRIQSLLASGVLPCVPTLTNSIGLRLALIPAGRFRMGSPAREPQRMDGETLHDVHVTKPFYLGVYPVTQAEYRAVTGKNPSSFRHESLEEEGPDTDRFPVERVSWTAAVAFCSKLS